MNRLFTLIIAALVITSHSIHTMRDHFPRDNMPIDPSLYCKDPYRFGPIQPIEKSKDELVSLYNQHEHGDHLYHYRRNIMAGMVLAKCFSPSKGMCDAIVKQDYSALKFFLEQGANPNEGWQWIDSRNASFDDPLITQARYIPIAKLLIDHGADIAKQGKWGNVLHYCEGVNYSPKLLAYYLKEHRDKLSVHARNPMMYDGNPLHALIFFHNTSEQPLLEKVRLFIDAGIDLSARDKNGHTAFEIAKRNIRREYSCYGSAEIQQELLALLKPQSIQQAVPASAQPSQSDDIPSCVICLDQLASDSQLNLSLPCSHTFHAECINAWRTQSATCPLCKREF